MLSIFLTSALLFQAQSDLKRWGPNDESRPRPKIIDAGLASTQSKVGSPPSDAVVLFRGDSLRKWESVKGGPAKWRVVKGEIEVVPKSGDIRSKQLFGDCQVHVEWCTPAKTPGSGQDLGNSGVWLMGLFEVQVLDSFSNKTYADGQAGAVYGQYPPLVNPSKKPGVWQSYDIVFHRPHFLGARLTAPARMTVFYNGVLVQDNVSLTGPVAFHKRPPYTPIPNRLPLMLQDHGNKVRFRNIWVRNLE